MQRSGREGRWVEIPSPRVRFGLEAAFLVLVALVAALLDLSARSIIILMGVAWLAVALVERAATPRAEEQEQEQEPFELSEPIEPEADVERRSVFSWLPWRRPEVAAEEALEPEPVDERPSRAHVRRIEADVSPIEDEAPAEAPALSEPEPVEPAPPVEPIVTTRRLDLSGIDAQAEPALEAAAPLPPPQPDPPPDPAPREPPPPPREWNLWELEKRAREHAGDQLRDEEWAALFLHLREFADADGLLPREFDGLVRDSFAELIHVA